ncbi:MAG: hypothetical protein KF729_10085 [Sandaracinaceae bacterium]|nr:hypothetical protein [Sandaracinaceae bacterium]
MRLAGFTLVVVFLGPSPVAADAVRTPPPVDRCPAGSVSATTGTGLFHGAFSYCAPRLCAAAGACPPGLECRELTLQTQLRSYTVGGGRGGPPRPRREVTEVTGTCADPAPGVVVPPPDRGLAGLLGDVSVGGGCQRIQVCAPRRLGDPLGTTPPVEPPPVEPPPEEAPPASVEAPPAEVRAPNAAPAPAVPASPPAAAAPADCGCRAAGDGGRGGLALAALAFAALGSRRRCSAWSR